MGRPTRRSLLRLAVCAALAGVAIWLLVTASASGDGWVNTWLAPWAACGARTSPASPWACC